MIRRWLASAVPVEKRDDFARGRQRALHPPGEVVDHLGRNAELPVGEVLDQHGFQQVVAGFGDPDHGQRAEARTQVGQGDRPFARQGAGGQQYAEALFAGQVEQME